MAWVLRGLRDGVVTTRYPAREDGYGSTFRATVEPTDDADLAADNDGPGADPDWSAAGDAALARLCPTRAIETGPGPGGRDAARVDQGRCILCGRCVDARPDRFAFSGSVESAAITRSGLVVPNLPEDDANLDRLRQQLHRRVRALRRSVHVRHVDAGSDGAEEWEVAALTNPVYDVQRLGIYFTATPRHADLLLVTGVGTAGMSLPLRQTLDAMPGPRVVIAAGTDAVSGGLVAPTYASGPGVGAIVPVDVWVPGSPPSPFSLLHGILLGIGLLPRDGRR
jgi:Ni,Fe-hydrogenase III small subunit/ferredoxin